VYSLPVIYTKKWSFTVVLGVAVGALLLTRLFSRRRRRTGWLNEKNVTAGVLTLFLLALVVLGDSWAQQTAKETATVMRDGNAKSIHFFFKEDSMTLYPKDFLDANNADKLKLLTQTKDRSVVFFQPE